MPSDVEAQSSHWNIESSYQGGCAGSSIGDPTCTLFALLRPLKAGK